MKTVSIFTSMLVVVLYVGVCAAEDISVLDDAILDYSSQDSNTVTASRYTTSDGKSYIVLDGADYDYVQTQIDGLEEADFAAFEDIPDDLRVHD